MCEQNQTMLLDICLNIEIHPESEAELMQNHRLPQVILAGLLISCGCSQQNPPAATPSASSTPATSAPATAAAPTETAQTQESSAVSAPQARPQPNAPLPPAGPEGKAQQF